MVKIKKILISLLVISLIIPPVLSKVNDKVIDTNNCNKGDILVGTGINSKNGSEGTWADSSFLKGEKGDAGNQGITGNTGSDGLAGNKGDTGLQGIAGKQGIKGNIGKKGERGIKGNTGKGLKNQYIGSIGVRLWDCQKHSAEIYYGYDFNNNNNIFEARIIIKFGKSYLDRKLEILEKKIKKLEITIK